MKNLVSAMCILILTLSIVKGQDLAGYEVVDNDQVGLTVAANEKWGTAVADIDRNGWPDIFTIRWSSPGYSRVYFNDQGVFTDITEQTPLEAIESQEFRTTTPSLVDFDNDGDKDIYFGTDKAIHLLRNDDNTFVDVAESVGLIGGKPGFVSSYEFRIGVWADYDLDGDLDVAIGQENNPNLLFFKNEGGTFVDVASELGFEGVTVHEGPFDYPSGTRGTRHLQWVDFDLDGDPDLCVGGKLFRNDNGQFTEISESVGFNPSQIQNADWFDYDNDGDLDYYKNVVRPAGDDVNELWENQDGTFVDVSLETGVDLRDRFAGLTIGDYENDGDQDIFIQLNIAPSLDVLLVNDEVVPGVRAFADVAEFVGITKTGDRKGAAFLDYDKDGFLDIYIPSADHSHILYHNLTIDNNWVGFILEGTESNRDAIGTLVKVVAGGQTQIRYTKIPTGWLVQDNPWVHFGLGKTTSIDSVIIRWPLGRVEVLTDVAINQYHEIKEGEATSVDNSVDKTSQPTSWCLEQNYPNPFSARGGSALGVNPQTSIVYELPKGSYVRLEIFNLLGQKVATLVDEKHGIGRYQIIWNGRNDNYQLLPSGIYIYRLQVRDAVLMRKMAFTR